MRGGTTESYSKEIGRLAALLSRNRVKIVDDHEYHPISYLMQDEELSTVLRKAENALETEHWQDSIRFSLDGFEFVRKKLLIPFPSEIVSFLGKIDEDTGNNIKVFKELVGRNRDKIDGLKDIPKEDIENWLDLLIDIVDLKDTKRYAYEYFKNLVPPKGKLEDVIFCLGQSQLNMAEGNPIIVKQPTARDANFYYNMMAYYILQWHLAGAI